ncbi:hypothetical protein K469DRAFT_695279 [Zopfia rhizophila CBS 207.26]|uniref:Uncharacterized protein n=1 Tax=Zopfia rhizophila CBS 207.26 TaxID=1314779 RepID=A0A6A6DJX3_9PEZI|nr:hypothetical protein K469DRAFT_695279 [Zopfia rhizophila CBS 207.26]
MLSTLRSVAFNAILLFAALSRAQIVKSQEVHSDAIHVDCSKNVEARLPLIYTINANASSWTPPPPGWILGNWKVTWSSSPGYVSLHNFEVDLSPVFPQSKTSVNQFNDLSSYQKEGEKNLTLYYGIDTMRSENDGIYNFTNAAKVFEYRLEIVAWGYDTAGVGYKVTYENKLDGIIPEALSVESRARHGPTNETLIEIVAKIEKLGSKTLSTLARGMVGLTQNGGRDGIPAICDAACIRGA